MAPGAFESETFTILSRWTFLEVKLLSDTERTRDRRCRSEDAPMRHRYSSCSHAGAVLPIAPTQQEREHSLGAAPGSSRQGPGIALRRSHSNSQVSLDPNSQVTVADTPRSSLAAELPGDDCPEPRAGALPEGGESAGTADAVACAGTLQAEQRLSHWSKGSTLHVIGLCKPCGFFWSSNGCHSGPQCIKCHLHDQDWRKSRRRAKMDALAEKKRLAVQAGQRVEGA